jgi:hypothetical protein
MNLKIWAQYLTIGLVGIGVAELLPIQRAPAQTAISVNISGCTSNPAAPSSIVGLLNGRLQCIPLGAGLSVTGGMVTVAPGAPYTPAWQVETVSLSSTPTTATSITYTPAKPVASGTVLWWYQSANLLESASGAVQYVGPPLAIGLPAGWAATDSFEIAYQSQ